MSLGTGMLLPNALDAVIEEPKLLDYLLNPAHPDNGGKAAFFAMYGFTAANWHAFAATIREMISRVEVIERVQSAWGEKFIVDGPLVYDSGMTPPVRTVWILNTGERSPRLVTAYPRK